MNLKTKIGYIPLYLKRRECAWCGNRIRWWQRQVWPAGKGYYHHDCFTHDRIDTVMKMAVEDKTDIPVTDEEILAGEYDGWSMESYLFYRLELHMTHEKARQGAFILTTKQSMERPKKRRQEHGKK